MLAPPLRVLGLAALVAAAGCSSDVTRFNLLGGDFLGWGGTPPPAAGPAGYAPDDHGYAPVGRSDRYGGGLQESALPPMPSSQPTGQGEYRPPGREYASGSPYPPAGHDRAPPPWTDRSPPPWTDKDPFPGSDSAQRQKPGPAGQASAPWQGRHVVQSGESLYAIAQRYKVSVEELKRVNSIGESTRVSAGKVLAVPEHVGGPFASAAPAAPAVPRVVQATPRVVAAPPPEPAAPQVPGPRTAARQDGTMTDATPTPASAAGKFRWPARGKILVGFGAQQPDGTRSEGINLAVPMGTDIHAAEAGRVHYVGDGLKGYGNLILIRHPNGWVSMYAHADKTLVKAGDEVKRGQVIGKAGTSGPVAEPQLRFELRKGSQPVDPVPLLAN